MLLTLVRSGVDLARMRDRNEQLEDELDASRSSHAFQVRGYLRVSGRDLERRLRASCAFLLWQTDGLEVKRLRTQVQDDEQVIATLRLEKGQ